MLIYGRELPNSPGRGSRSAAARPSTAWGDALLRAFHSTQGHSAQDERSK